MGFWLFGFGLLLVDEPEGGLEELEELEEQGADELDEEQEPLAPPQGFLAPPPEEGWAELREIR